MDSELSKTESELKKIELDTTVANSAVNGMKPKRKRSAKWFLVLLIPIVVVLVGVGALTAMLLPLRGVIDQGKEVVVAAREVATAGKEQDLEKAKSSLRVTREKLVSMNIEYGKVKIVKAVPILGSYVSDGEHALNAAFAGLDALDRALEALEPNADLLGLKGGSKFVMGSADERIQTAVKTMKALTPKVNEMATHIDTLRKELDQINPDRYPEKIGQTVIRQRLVSTKDLIDEAANLFVNAQPLLINLPTMLGEPLTKRYLVLFFNDKELRASGGFITAYALFRLEKGKIVYEKSDDIYSLDDSIKNKLPATKEILTFHKNVYNLHIRDSNLSPDFKVSMQKFEELYAKTSEKEKIDGIFAMDTHVLVEVLRILGPMTVGGREFSADIDKRCDCPKAVYELEDYSTRPVNYVRTDRKDIIGILLKDIMQKALGVSPSQYWGKLSQMLLSEIQEKHVQAYFHESELQTAAESFNMAGRIMTKNETAKLFKYSEGEGWDYLHINNSNMAGAKSNMFVNEKFTKDVTVGSDGTVTTKLTVDYKNPYPGSDCNLERGGLCLNAPLRNWVRVYTPAGSKLVESKGVISPKDGKSVSMDTYESLGKAVFEGFLIVNPLGSSRLELTYTSPIRSSDGKYRLLIQKQPGTDGQEVVIRLGGRERKKFELATDTEIVL